MEIIKTYNQVNDGVDNLSFRVSRLEDIYDMRQGETDKPHRHNYYTVICTVHAKGSHFVDFTTYPLNGGQIFFVSPGQVHQMLEEERSMGYGILFSENFLIQNNIPVDFIDNLQLFNDFGLSPPLGLNNEEQEKISRYAEEMIQMGNSNILFKYNALGALLKLILIHCNNICTLKKVDTPIMETGSQLLREFKKLIKKHFTEWHATGDYAKKLHITPDHLNRVVKSLTGKTAKEHIQSRIIVGAKYLIYFTPLSNKEIGYRLGFNEPAHFSSFFKKKTGLSPSQYRKTI